MVQYLWYFLHCLINDGLKHKTHIGKNVKTVGCSLSKMQTLWIHHYIYHPHKLFDQHSMISTVSCCIFSLWHLKDEKLILIMLFYANIIIISWNMVISGLAAGLEPLTDSTHWYLSTNLSTRPLSLKSDHSETCMILFGNGPCQSS